jgi:hypothetical protein
MCENPDKVTKLCKKIGSLGEERQSNINKNPHFQKETEHDIRRTCLELLAELLYNKKKPTSE